MAPTTRTPRAGTTGRCGSLKRGWRRDAACSPAPSSSPTPSPRSAGVPPADELFAQLIGIEALLGGGTAGRSRRANRDTSAGEGRSPHDAWRVGRVPARCAARRTQTRRAPRGLSRPGAERDVFDLLGERYQAALSHLALGRLAARAGARSLRGATLAGGAHLVRTLGAARDARDTAKRAGPAGAPGTGEFIGTPADADDAMVRRLVDAAALPDLLARETAVRAPRNHRTPTPLSSSSRAPGGSSRRIDRARRRRRQRIAAVRAAVNGRRRRIAAGTEPLGADKDGPRASRSRSRGRPAISSSGAAACSRAVARQGFELSEARERPGRRATQRDRVARAADPRAFSA